MKNLAKVEKINEIRPHPNADKLEIATVLGWQVVVKKGEFKKGDLCIYVVTDTVLPENPEFEFLRNKNFRIKPIRLRGQSSNGICFPLSIVQEPLSESTDVTELLGVTHYEKPISSQLSGNAIGHIPSFLQVTDEDNLRTYPDALKEIIGESFYITRKDDGSSCTCYLQDDKFGVCSRKIDLEKNLANGFWKMAIKYNIEEKLRDFISDGHSTGVALQGEVVGPGVQKNPLGLEELEFHPFGLFNISNRQHYPYQALKEFCTKHELAMVVVVNEGDSFSYSLESLIELANEVKYPNGSPAEGIVIRPTRHMHSQILNKQWSGKVISELYED
jgi:RNA ligase (TIGR02306 family)